MTIRKPTRPMNLDYWQLTSQIQQTLAETGGMAPQSPTTQQPITITTTNVRTGEVKKQTIPAGTSVESIKREAQKRLAAQEDERIDVEVDGKELKLTGISIPMTQAELDAVAEHNANVSCQRDIQHINTYKVSGYDKDHNWVSVTVQEVNKKNAKKKAAATGLNVKQVTRQIGTPTTASTKVTVLSGDTIKVKDGKTGDTLEFSKEGWEAWPDKYKTLVKTDGFDAAMKAFKKDYYECADGSFILKKDFYAMPTYYADVLATRGFAAMQSEFENAHVQLGGGQWIPKADWDVLVANDKELGTNFAEIGKEQGYAPMIKAIDEANEPYEDFLKKLDSGDIIAVGKNEYITKEEFNKLPSGSQQILKEGGFAAFEDISTKRWQNISEPSKVLTDTEYKKLCDDYDAKLQKLASQGKNMYEIVDAIGHNPANEYALDGKSAQRALIGLASMVVPPAKAALPEYTIKDITPIEWALTGANVALIAIGFAPGAIAGSTVGKVAVVGLSSTMGGMIGYETAKNWASLTPGQRAMGVGVTVLCAIPFITTVARNVKISGTAIPTTKGNITTWKGLSVAGHPIIGRSGGKWVLGTRSITLPEARMILNGYKPELMLETKVFVNDTALKAAGWTRDQIDYLNATLKSRNLFAGKSSPWLDKNVLIEPTQRLTANEISIIQRQLAKLGEGKLKDAHLLYGSPTIKAQLAPELRNWRALHDWDISLNMNQAKTEAWTKALYSELKAKGGATYRINPEIPTLIEKRVGNTWEHIADIHSMEQVISEIPASSLDATGTYSYGRMVSEPAITIKYPGVGELNIMRLSESGVRKADTILRVRQTAEGTAFRPPERGIAQPGVPKDAADFYVTTRTFLGEEVAEEWLESWAKAMGYNKTQLKTVLPKIREAMLEVAAKTPSDIIGYEFKPASSPNVSPGATPSIIVHIPSSLGASVSAKLEGKISKPIYPYKLAKSPEIKAATSAAISAYLASLPDKSLSSVISKAPSKVSSMAKVSPKPSPSPSMSTSPSPSPRPSPSIVPSLSPSVKPSPSSKPSKAPSIVPSPKPSPTPSPQPVPSPKPSPYPYPSTKPGPKPKPIPRMATTKPSKKIRREKPPLAVWDQGMYFVTVYPPFRTKGREPGKPGKPDVVYSRERPPWATKVVKGKRSPQRSLQTFGKVPDPLVVPMGKVVARIRGGRTLTFSRRNGNRKRGRIIY